MCAVAAVSVVGGLLEYSSSADSKDLVFAIGMGLFGGLLGLVTVARFVNPYQEFHDDKVVEQSKKFVMIRLDKDKNAELSKKYAPDGEYIPRTYFLSSAAVLDPTLTAPRDQYKYFYDEHDPAQLLAAMDAALKKLK